MIEFDPNKNPIIKRAAQFAGSHLARKLPDNMYFHDFDHTMDVAKAVEEICKHSPEITEQDEEILLLAAWFHDLGYCETYRGHEQISENIAREFLENEKYPEDKINSVINCIRATEYRVKPESKLEKVISDADLFHLSTEKFFTKSEALRREFCEYGLRDEMSDKDWLKLNLLFIEQHQYSSSYGLEVLEQGKQSNILKLKSKLKSAKKQDKVIDKLLKENQKLSEKLDKAKLKASRPDRSKETMFKTALKNHFNRSNMANIKANIMIAINAIIILIVLTRADIHLEANSFIITAAFLTTASLVSLAFAIWATIPKVTKHSIKREDLLNNDISLMFFSNSYKMNYKDYEWRMNELMKDADLLYENITREIFYLGKILEHKHSLLRISYMIFILGLLISVIIFIITLARN